MKDDVHPVGLKLAGLECLVVGSGPETRPRADALRHAGAVVRVVSEHPSRELEDAAAAGGYTLEVRGFVESDLDRVWLAVLADKNDELARLMGELAAQRRVFFCAIDQPQHSTFSHFAISRSGDVTVAISTNGRAPALARRLREEIDRLLASVELPAFVERLAELREKTSSTERKRVLSDAVAGVRIDGKVVLPKRTE